MKNSYRFEGDKCYIYLRNIDKETVIDAEDFPIVDAFPFTWYGQYNKQKTCCYAHIKVPDTEGKQATLLMHRIILCLTDRKIHSDHINHDTLDNTKNNLKSVTCSENMQNTTRYINNKSGYKGVSIDKRRNKYRAEIMVKRKSVYIGDFSTPEEAHHAYQEAVKKYHPYMAKLQEENEVNNGTT